MENLKNLTQPLRALACMTYIEEGGDPESARGKDYIKYIKANADKLMELAFERPAMLSGMCRQKLLTPKFLELYLDEAEKRGDVEAKAMLMDYRQNGVGMKKMDQARARRAEKAEKDAETIVDRAVARADQDNLIGLTFAITGKLQRCKKRDDLKRLLEGCGATLADAVGPKVDFLVTNDTETGSEKNQKAASLGIQVITEEELFNLPGLRWTMQEGDVTVPEGVTDIGIAFKGNKKLCRITLPKSLTAIGNDSFCGCSKLVEVNIPDTVTMIGEYAFYKCKALKQVILPEGVRELGWGAFSECVKLERVSLPDSLTRIGCNAFYSCKRLSTINLPDGLKEIGMDAFVDCPGETISALEEFASAHPDCAVDVYIE